MTLRISNTTCDIYRSSNSPPADPDVAGVVCFLRGDYRGGNEAADLGEASRTWTHVLMTDPTVDIRDDASGSGAITGTSYDTVYVPDQNGTAFKVVFVERVARGTDADHKRAYLQRQTPTWPTDNV